MTAETDIDLIMKSWADAISMNQRFATRDGLNATSIFVISKATPAAQWRGLIERLNEVDPDQGWGRMKLLGQEYVARRGDFPGGDFS